MFFFKQQSQPNQEDDWAFQAGACINGGHADIIAGIIILWVERGIFPEPVIDGLDEIFHTPAATVQQEQMFPGKPLFYQAGHFVGDAGNLILLTGEGDDLRDRSVRHVEQIGNKNIVILFLSQA